jgi:hypothetical protein
MRKACLVVSDYLNDNRIFKPGAFRDDINYKYIRLREALFEKGIDLSTEDVSPIAESDIVIYASDMPKKLPSRNDADKSFLILWESEFIRPDNYNKSNHDMFKKVFTWHDKFVDNKKYIKINFVHRFPEKINKDINNKESLCVLIAGNKKPPYTKIGDLYSEREKAIRWFEENHPNDFDLYGVGWNRYRFSGPKLFRALNRIPMLPEIYMKFTACGYPSYKGMVARKKPIMEKYKFSICYENVQGIPGYITEKIFDSFFAGCVPIYLGADNISDYIPKNCFVDKRDFNSYECLYQFMNGIGEVEYLNYLDNIQYFLNSEQARQFQAESFANIVCSAVMRR